MAQQQLAQSDPALDAFDRLKVQMVQGWYNDTAATFLAKFQSTTASLGWWEESLRGLSVLWWYVTGWDSGKSVTTSILGPEERIRLELVEAPKSVELLKVVLADPQAIKVCSLDWRYDGGEDVNSILPLLTSNFPELASLKVTFEHHSALDFVSSVLEHSSNKVKVLHMPRYTGGNLPRFFAALGQSQVSALTLSGWRSPEFHQGLCDYLAKNLLVRLKVWMDNDQFALEMVTSLAKCTRLAKLEMLWCTLSQPSTFTHLPKSITKLVLYNCTFAGGFDWSFLADNNLQELDIQDVSGVDGSQLGGALAVHLKAKGLDKLCLHHCDFVDETLAAVGVELGRIKRLFASSLNDASIKLIALALQSSNNEVRELVLKYEDDTANSIETHLVPALRCLNCSLAKLRLWAYQPERKAAAKQLQDTFYMRRALFVVLQGQQVRKVYCPLRRLPVEMFRMVGEVLL